MKVYELMDELSELPAGADIRIRMIKELSELPRYEDGLRNIDFQLKDVDVDPAGTVILDGWND